MSIANNIDFKINMQIEHKLSNLIMPRYEIEIYNVVNLANASICWYHMAIFLKY